MSSATKALLASIWHPTEVAALLQYSVSSSNSSNSGNLNSDASSSFDAAAGNNSCIRRDSFVKSYEYLNATSRSFARVIQELHPKLRHAVCIFYLVLRGNASGRRGGGRMVRLYPVKYFPELFLLIDPFSQNLHVFFYNKRSRYH